MLKVEIINKDEVVDLFKHWGEFACECYSTPIDKAENVGKHCKKSGHTSGSRADYIKFRISGISRNCSMQLNRAEVGVVKNQASQRYISFDNAEFVAPHKVQQNNEALEEFNKMKQASLNSYKRIQEFLLEDGLTKEQANESARCVLLGSCETNGTWAFTYEALVNFMHKRLCVRAEKEISDLAKAMRNEVLELLPTLENDLVSACEYLLWCPESKGCGRCTNKQQLKERLK